jgi:hypothetical protein
MPAFQAENEGASPSYRTKNLESRDLDCIRRPVVYDT